MNVLKNGKVKPLLEWYENFDENSKRTLEEATTKYMNVYSKALIELMFEIPKSLYKFWEKRDCKRKRRKAKIICIS